MDSADHHSRGHKIALAADVPGALAWAVLALIEPLGRMPKALPSHICAIVRRSRKNAERSALARVFGGWTCTTLMMPPAQSTSKRERIPRAQGHGETRTSGKRSDGTSNCARPNA